MFFTPNKTVLSSMQVARNRATLLSKKLHKVHSDLSDEDDSRDWKEEAIQLQKDLENANSDLYDTNEMINALSRKISVWESEFDKTNLPQLLIAISDISNYQEAYRASQLYNRKWFVSAMLSEDGKVRFAQALMDKLDPLLNGANLNFISRVAERNSQTLNSLLVDPGTETDQEA